MTSVATCAKLDDPSCEAVRPDGNEPPDMTCPLCGVRKARRACPGLGQDICAVCCGTKRLVEIACPPSCGYLQAARTHPAAIEQRQRERDLAVIVPAIRDLTEPQQQLFFWLLGVVLQQAGDLLRPVIDEDVADAAGALAATYETAARGLIYEHQAQSLPAQRVLTELKAVLGELAGDGRARLVERDAPLALRAIERSAREVAASPAVRTTAYIDLVRRVVGPGAQNAGRVPEAEESSARSSLILPPN